MKTIHKTYIKSVKGGYEVHQGREWIGPKHKRTFSKMFVGILSSWE